MSPKRQKKKLAETCGICYNSNHSIKFVMEVCMPDSEDGDTSPYHSQKGTGICAGTAYQIKQAVYFQTAALYIRKGIAASGDEAMPFCV